MRSSIYTSTFLVVLMYSSNMFALTNVCGFGPVPEGNEDLTIYHYMTFDPFDRYLGWAHHLTSGGGPDVGYGWYEDIIPIQNPIFVPYQIIWWGDPDPGVYSINGESQTGYYWTGPEGGFYPDIWGSCFKGPFTLWPEPQVGIEILPATIVYEGANIEITWNSQNADNCYYGDLAIGTSGTSGVMTASIAEHNKTYVVKCKNANGIWGETSATATVLPQPPACTVNFNLSSSFTISSGVVPSMPVISASVTNLVPSNATVNWTAKVNHSSPLGCSVLNNNFDSNISTGSGSTFSPSFNGIYGGDLTVTATCSAPNYTNNSSTNTSYDITGAQPSISNIVDTIATVGSPFYPSDLRKIACHESSLRQFATSGFPLYGSQGARGDVGTMQICYNRQPRDLWDYTFNISSGRNILLYAPVPSTTWLNSQVSLGAPPYSTALLRDESVHRYNAGTGQSEDAYREWNQNLMEWNIVHRGGIQNGIYVSLVDAKSPSCTN